jgi:hypothetical protein
MKLPAPGVQSCDGPRGRTRQRAFSRETHEVSVPERASRAPQLRCLRKIASTVQLSGVRAWALCLYATPETSFGLPRARTFCSDDPPGRVLLIVARSGAAERVRFAHAIGLQTSDF